MSADDTQRAAGYAELNIGRLYLLMARSQVARIVPAKAVEFDGGNGAWCGRIHVAGVDWPVLSLDEFLQPAPAAAGKRVYCALLRAGRYGYALLADAVSSRTVDEVRRVGLPTILAAETVALSGLGLVDDYVAGLADAEKILFRFARLRGTTTGEVLEFAP